MPTPVQSLDSARQPCPVHPAQRRFSRGDGYLVAAPLGVRDSFGVGSEGAAAADVARAARHASRRLVRRIFCLRRLAGSCGVVICVA
jgi:hypothetical protein